MGLLSKKDRSKLPSELDIEVNHGKSLRSQTEDDTEFDPSTLKKPRVKANPYPVYFIFWSTLIFSFFFLFYRKADSLIKSGQVTPLKSDLNLSPSTISYYFKKITGSLSVANLSPGDIDKNINNLLKDNARNWAVSVEVYPVSTGVSKSWSYNATILDNKENSVLLYELKNTAPTTSTLLLSSGNLPQGVTIRQLYTEANQIVKLDALLTVPTKDMLIRIKAIDQIDLNKASRTIPELVSLIYWSFAGNN